MSDWTMATGIRPVHPNAWVIMIAPTQAATIQPISSRNRRSVWREPPAGTAAGYGRSDRGRSSDGSSESMGGPIASGRPPT